MCKSDFSNTTCITMTKKSSFETTLFFSASCYCGFRLLFQYYGLVLIWEVCSCVSKHHLICFCGVCINYILKDVENKQQINILALMPCINTCSLSAIFGQGSEHQTCAHAWHQWWEQPFRSMVPSWRLSLWRRCLKNSKSGSGRKLWETL